MVTSSSLLLQFSNQMKSKGLLILISIRMVIGWIGVVASVLNFGKPPFYIAIGFTLYFFITSFLGKHFLQNKQTNPIGNRWIMLFLGIDFIVLLFGFCLSIFAHPEGMKALPIQNSIFFSLFFLYQLYISFFLHRTFSIVMGIIVSCGYLSGIFFAHQLGVEIDFGYQLSPQGPNRVVFVLEILKVILLIAKTICIVKLVSFLLDILENNNQKLANELNERETSLIQTDRLVTLGSLASNVAHEIKNPLAGILSMVNFLLEEERRYLTNREPLWKEKEERIVWKHRTKKQKREELDVILQLFSFLPRNDAFYLADRCIDLGIDYKSFEGMGAEEGRDWEFVFAWLKYKTMENANLLISNSIHRTEKVISTFQQFSKPFQNSEKEIVRIGDGLRDILILYSQYLAMNRNLNTEIDDRLEAYVNEPAIKLVWSHLIYNAIQATPHKSGEIHVKVFRNDENQIEVNFMDNGIGIPSHLQSSIFQPFFTTKEKGEGIGLGLFICKNIINDQAGTIHFHSEPGKTIFRVCLPETKRMDHGSDE
ncbi:two-component sensor histidine kinase [Leptospira yanagawae]|uniref:histidine kinase n=1 Tax=Leptospira yanagawae TaxID=293069 RepID=A0ABY2LZ53_9LEPT|nr:ATP-binding protein [Leptospira yanagawae]TGL19005.1 two-component sensor histidine kinase [Leptospira yanagawae]